MSQGQTSLLQSTGLPEATGLDGDVGAGVLITCPVTWGIRCEMLLVLLIFVTSRLDMFHKASVFRNIRVVTLTALLGLLLQEAYLQTRSLWPGIIMHWLWAWSWVTFGAPEDLRV